jgi:murein DD-endopeptidase MepM/ murein hydrolase activator NlpD
MRYPVGNGTREEFERDWYVAYSFGNPSLHEGVDINLKSGGNTDYGFPLYAIANGRIIYYHYGTHPGSNFGRHIVYKIEGAWGSRWVHYAHCHSDNFLNSVQDVTEGQMIARIGNSGTPLAHLHMSIYKVDPITIGGIDRVARTVTELNTYWEDPLAFIRLWSIGQPVITEDTRIPQIENFTVREICDILNNQQNKLEQIRLIVQ